MQQSVRSYDVLDTELNFATRPFYIIDLAYPGNFRFVYLDEEDDPMVYHIDERDGSIGTFGQTLSQLINILLGILIGCFNILPEVTFINVSSG
ncbi:hypothetical protein P8625_13605 [Tenacibaculum tangerinum]|uniref:Uncharacterized protein n=1 Tax=Tenacibaculum tangerinum TaxID=3038772 RepID=A0ABY8L1D3_9FLAO|nr:hypothetical protein [Tenacibaculum tangerinum]WGH75096.1 hypothetical protein P8625_13605 [Tenacibaculum tangerinum]